MEEKYIPKNKKTAFVKLIAYLKPYKWPVAVGILCNIGVGIVALVPPPIYGKITDKVVLAHGIPVSKRYSILAVCALSLLVAYALGALMTFARTYTMHILGERVILGLRKQIYSRLQALSISFFDSRQTGELMSRVTNDTEAVEEFVVHAADTIISDTIRLIAMVVVMFWLSPVLTLVALAPIPLVFLLTYSFARRVRKVYRAVRERLAEINAKVQENLSGIRVIKAFARENYEQASFNNDAQAYFDMRVKAIKMWTTFYPPVDMLIRTGQVAIWVVGPYLVINHHATLGLVVIFTMYMQMLFEPVNNLARINDVVQRSLAATERVFEVIDEEPVIQDAEDAIELPRVAGRVEFDHIDFKYEEGEEVLRDICIKAEPGQIVALVGRSGAGKTSIVNLIPRFYDPINGRVLIDGYDVRYVKQASLRNQIAMVLQDTFLFNGTIADNIRYGRLEATDEEIIEAAKAANAHEFIEVMPSSYGTEIGERGIKLSGGQKQRLAIARAILADPRILILDEATSSVDSESEYLIHRAMDRLMEGRTTFVIAHRLSTVKHANQIITLEGGCVSEVGDHKTLLEMDGVYSQMYAMQFRLDEER